MSESSASASAELVAVIGMACRFPGARNVEEFWRLIQEGEEYVTRFSDEEVRASGVPDDVVADPNYVKVSSILDEVELFETAFTDAAGECSFTVEPEAFGTALVTALAVEIALGLYALERRSVSRRTGLALAARMRLRLSLIHI